MKKIILTVIGICFLFLSCENESLDFQEDALQENLSFSQSLSSNSSSGCIPDLEALELSLPDTVTATTTAKPGVDAYFSLDILDTDLAGTDIAAWCVDQDLSLNQEETLEFAVYSSYETLPAGEFEFPENFDLVNWVENQNFVGKASPSGGTYTFGHVQYAIWKLVDDSICVSCSFLTSPTGTWNTDSDNNIAKAQEIVDAAIANGQDFVPGCGEKVGVILNPAGKQAIIIFVDVPEKEIEEECFECEGKVTELELQYNGSQPANIIVKTKKEGEGGSKIVFEGNVAPGETFSFIGNDKKGTLGTEIKIYVDGNENTKIHTSCSKPIGPGLISGDFKVVSGTSREGGNLCPVDTPPNDDSDCSECEGKVTELELQYDGGIIADIVVKTKGKGKNKEGAIVFEGTVNPGETFSFIGNDDKGTLGTEISIYVNGSLDQKIHTSCSVPIGPSATFGDYIVISGKSREGGELCNTNYSDDDDDDDDDDTDCDCDGKLTELDLVYTGDNDLIIVKTKGKGKDKEGTVLFEGNLDNGGIIELVGNDKHGTLGTEIKIYIGGSESAKIHTSCSDPNVVPGYIVGDFEVIRGASRNNGELCPNESDGH
ncbi:hypothetical protein [uncultured Algibacter sp.]|uniref:DUF7467 domain-containing protein n=1 Tax=uncultured Algibacter sp. TaxID=298659 RepID=UPI0026141A21|nr:hypothetical protein [uncultured Algibacter sp.]